jgi:hypothetical protein
MSIARGTSQFFPVIIQNDGFLPTSFKLKGTGAASGYTVTYTDYYNNNANITGAVRNGTFSTGMIAPGQYFTMKMMVKVSPNAAATATFAVIAGSAGTPKDVVKGIVRAT